MREGEGGGILCRTKHGREVRMKVDSGEGGWGRGVLGNKEKKSRERERKCRGEKESGEILKDPWAVQGPWGLRGSWGSLGVARVSRHSNGHLLSAKVKPGAPLVAPPQPPVLGTSASPFPVRKRS